ncbi:DKNYY domain-containing protein [Terrimonas sp. NA20]|uniref:DKNYY domain-containing protein n=1 Tax=Terrimonas ginsenosidimutans TaxID=2908004 RepID=A0ABS9KSD4_9BACT|nr:DKNYY domain-containing protein [Terrimonas ginsenosidimutans]MCG2615247.1 DKNYY domain-containing protein [Terrimonas ginsenosidimutans]
MKWLIKTILILAGIIPLSRCSSGYKQKDGKLTFNGKELTGDGWQILNTSFAVNDSIIYYKEKIVEDADATSFEALDEHYAKDKNNVYYCEEYRDGQTYYTTKKQTIVTLGNASPASFQVLGDNYAKDHKHAYYKDKPFKVRELASLEVVTMRFVKDRYGVYLDQNPVNNADPKSFRILNSNYASDTNRIYYYGYPSDVHNGIHEINCDRQTFSLLAYPYSQDNKSVYYLYTKIPGSDPASFVALESGYSKDRVNVYKDGKIVKGAEPVTFTVPTE